MNRIVKIIEYFETYRGHDQSLGIIGYGSQMVSNCFVFKINISFLIFFKLKLSGAFKRNEKISSKLKKISSEISNARVILRFLDDFPMLGYTVSYGLGKQVRIDY